MKTKSLVLLFTSLSLSSAVMADELVGPTPVPAQDPNIQVPPAPAPVPLPEGVIVEGEGDGVTINVDGDLIINGRAAGSSGAGSGGTLNGHYTDVMRWCDSRQSVIAEILWEQSEQMGRGIGPEQPRWLNHKLAFETLQDGLERLSATPAPGYSLTNFAIESGKELFQRLRGRVRELGRDSHTRQDFRSLYFFAKKYYDFISTTAVEYDHDYIRLHNRGGYFSCNQCANGLPWGEGFDPREEGRSMLAFTDLILTIPTHPSIAWITYTGRGGLAPVGNIEMVLDAVEFLARMAGEVLYESIYHDQAYCLISDLAVTSERLYQWNFHRIGMPNGDESALRYAEMRLTDSMLKLTELRQNMSIKGCPPQGYRRPLPILERAGSVLSPSVDRFIKGPNSCGACSENSGHTHR